MSVQSLFNEPLLSKYNINGPRYTSYPTALEFTSLPQLNPLEAAFDQSRLQPLSLYIHIPFCHQLCYYCGCNKIVTRHQEKADRYLDYLEKEIKQLPACAKASLVKQIHLGGGSPSFLTLAQQNRLMTLLTNHFTLHPAVQKSIEIDPRGVTSEYLSGLKKLGFNRLSIGVQDTSKKVQQAINRVQETSHIASLVSDAKQMDMTSVNLDLIYGLPHQTVATFNDTLDQVLKMRPHRVSLFSYAHLPSRFAAQRKINDAWLPQAHNKTALMKLAMEVLCREGYELIGMDHFALPHDELAQAQQAGELHRNFQGYTTMGDLNLLGLGVSSISAVGPAYLQNPKTLNDYYSKLDNGEPTQDHGCFLSRDDIIRRYVIQELMCNLRINTDDVEKRFSLCFADYFDKELTALQTFIDDKIITARTGDIYVKPNARLFIRVIAMTFDAYLAQKSNLHRYSRVI